MILHKVLKWLRQNMSEFTVTKDIPYHTREGELWGRITTLCSIDTNSLAHGRFERNLRKVIFKLILMIGGWGIFCKIALRWVSMDFTDDVIIGSLVHNELKKYMYYFILLIHISIDFKHNITDTHPPHLIAAADALTYSVPCHQQYTHKLYFLLKAAWLSLVSETREVVQQQVELEIADDELIYICDKCGGMLQTLYVLNFSNKIKMFLNCVEFPIMRSR